MTCKQCHRPMRHGNKTIAEYPGTVRHAGQRMCNTCYAKHAVEPCNQCERPTRPASAPLRLFPDTVLRTKSGLCTTCDRQATEAAEEAASIAAVAARVAAKPLEQFVHLAAADAPNRYQAECHWGKCAWGTVQTTPYAQLHTARTHARTHGWRLR